MHQVEMTLGGRQLHDARAGRLAKQANAAVTVRYGDTVILCTVTASSGPKDLDFFPLTVTMKKGCMRLVKFQADLLSAKAVQAKRRFFPAA